MFKIKSKITDHIEDLKTWSIKDLPLDTGDVEGVIGITIGKKSYGNYDYHSYPLKPGVLGGEYIAWWFDYLLNCAKCIRETKYYAFAYPESCDAWLEFELIDNAIVFRYATVGHWIPAKNNRPGEIFVRPKDAEFLALRTRHITVKYSKFKYDETTTHEIDLDDFFQEIINATRAFLDDLNDINPELIAGGGWTKAIPPLLSEVEATFQI